MAICTLRLASIGPQPLAGLTPHRPASLAAGAGEWEAFRACVAALPDDVPSRLFLSRCETYIRSGVGPGWTGIHKLKQK